MKYLVINADDFGRAHNNNLAIADLLNKPQGERIITDVNLMVNMPGTKEAVSLAKKYNIPLGIHFILTSDSSVLKAYPLSGNCPSLVQKDGSFHNPILNPQKFWEKTIVSYKPAEVKVEIGAQMNLFVELLEKLPSHLTTHHHVHAYPTLLPIFMKLAQRYNFPLRIPIIKTTLPSKQLLKALKRKVLMTDNFLTGYKGSPRTSNIDHLIKLLKDCPIGITELMVHPAYPDENAAVELNALWENELKVLTNPSLPTIIRKLGFTLINYSELKNYVNR